MRDWIFFSPKSASSASKRLETIQVFSYIWRYREAFVRTSRYYCLLTSTLILLPSSRTCNSFFFNKLAWLSNCFVHVVFDLKSEERSLDEGIFSWSQRYTGVRFYRDLCNWFSSCLLPEIEYQTDNTKDLLRYIMGGFFSSCQKF